MFKNGNRIPALNMRRWNMVGFLSRTKTTCYFSKPLLEDQVERFDQESEVWSLLSCTYQSQSSKCSGTVRACSRAPRAGMGWRWGTEATLVTVRFFLPKPPPGSPSSLAAWAQPLSLGFSPSFLVGSFWPVSGRLSSRSPSASLGHNAKAPPGVCIWIGSQASSQTMRLA